LWNYLTKRSKAEEVPPLKYKNFENKEKRFKRHKNELEGKNKLVLKQQIKLSYHNKRSMRVSHIIQNTKNVKFWKTQ
jgi:hypothetical protein